jgi:hypothetical protein
MNTEMYLVSSSLKVKRHNGTLRALIATCGHGLQNMSNGFNTFQATLLNIPQYSNDN